MFRRSESEFWTESVAAPCFDRNPSEVRSPWPDAQRREQRYCKKAQMLLSIVMLAVCDATLSHTWVDRDTPVSELASISPDGTVYELAFSDEFEADGRTFRDGDDPRWTALDSKPNGNSQVNLYNSSLAVTQGGLLRMSTRARNATYPTFSQPAEATAHFESALLMGWNKFCISGGGIIRMRARLPGRYNQPGLWPAFWLFGNLGRVTFPRTTNGLWPFIYDEHECVTDGDPDCEANQCRMQRVSACNAAPGYGMLPHQSRGAPEIDIFEVQPGNTPVDYGTWYRSGNCAVPDQKTVDAAYMTHPFLSASLQAAPGLLRRADQRPSVGCVPEMYTLADGSTHKQWYEGLGLRDVHNFSSPSHRVASNYFFWGEYFDDVSWPGGPSDLGMQTDAFSADVSLAETHFEDFHEYTLEYESGDGGFIRWSIDGVRIFEVTDAQLRRWHNVSVGGRLIGELRSRQVPTEPMYIVLNVDMSPKWGWPTTMYSQCGSCAHPNNMDCGNPDCTYCEVVRHLQPSLSCMLPLCEPCMMRSGSLLHFCLLLECHA